MRKLCFSPLVFLACALLSRAAEPRDLMSDTWVATDALGRTLPGHAECGPPKKDRTVGIFYFLWLGQHGATGPHVIADIIKHPKGKRPWGPPGRFHHWAEPEMGYYVSTDEYVVRKHAAMLAQAGVDVLFFDVTNGFTYDKPLGIVCRTLRQMRAEGSATPQIAFLTHSAHDKVVNHLYQTFYRKQQYRELWFYWLGKPLILSRHDGLDANVQAFFTFRRSWAWSAAPWFGDGRHRWPWLDHTPQRGGWRVEGVMEQIPVAVAQHPVTSIGRSHQAKKQPPPEKQQPDRGLYFAEQGHRALEVDPPFVFVTGWNEWVAQRFLAKNPRPFAGGRIEKGDTYFVDLYSQEYSRDIEPMAGGHTDNYYYQLVDLVRRYKGVRPVPKASPEKMMLIDGRFEGWSEAAPEYRDAAFDTAHRDHPGWGAAGRLMNTTGRNDFVTLKVAADATNVYFYAQTRERITPS
ncbi:hypothetical protein HQ560_21930, partial [bacterium]|nr:hypothetical protein [bacterium]